MNALGMIEVYGYLTAVEALDSALKAANVRMVDVILVRGGLVTVLVTGDVGAVKAAIDASRTAAERVGRVISVHVIPRPSERIEKMLPSRTTHTPISKTLSETRNHQKTASVKEETSSISPELSIGNSEIIDAPVPELKEEVERQQEPGDQKEVEPQQTLDVQEEVELQQKPEVLEEVELRQKPEVLEEAKLQHKSELPVEDSSTEMSEKQLDDAGSQMSKNESIAVHDNEEERERVTPEQLKTMTVERLRSLARELGITNMTKKQIRFATKQELIESISKFIEQER